MGLVENIYYMKHLKLFEYLDTETSNLMRYLRMSDEDKRYELLMQYNYLADEMNFIEDKREEIEEVCDVDALTELYYDCEDDMLQFIDEIKERYPEVYEILAEYAWDAIQNGDGATSDAEKPSWIFLEFVNIIKKNTWLVHLTTKEAARDIARNGFTKGIPDMGTLGLTTHFTDYAKQGGGYNFAYTVEDFMKYARESSSHREFRYGEAIVIFQAAGVRCFHNTDDEHQVIFFGNTATNIKQILHEEETESRDDIDDEVVMASLMKSGSRIVNKYIASPHFRYVGAIKSTILQLAKEPDALVKIKAFNPSVFQQIYYYFVTKIYKSGNWFMKDSRGREVHRAETPDEIMKWYETHYSQVK